MLTKNTGSRIAGYGHRDIITAYLFILPVVLIIGIFVIFPSIKLLVNSFQSVSIMGGAGRFVGLENFKAIFKSHDVANSFQATLKFMVTVVIVQTSLALFLALQVSKSVSGIGFFKTVYFFPVVVSFVVISFLWRFAYSRDFGPINAFLNFVGLNRQGFLSDPDQALWCVIATSIWKSWPFFMMIFLVGLKEIPKELYESAGIDGASRFQEFIYITFPMLKRTTLFIVVITTMDSVVKVFVPVFTMTGGGPRGKTNVLIHYIWQQAFRLGDVGFASAVAVVMFIFIFIVGIIQFKLLSGKKG